MKYTKWIIAVIIGGCAGFAFWYFIGCNSGSCTITSSPVNSSIYGAVMGVLIVNAFPGDIKKSNRRNNDQ